MTPAASHARVAAELRAVALAIRLFGLDALPAVMARSRQAEAGEQPDLFNTTTGDE